MGGGKLVDLFGGEIHLIKFLRTFQNKACRFDKLLGVRKNELPYSEQIDLNELQSIIL